MRGSQVPSCLTSLVNTFRLVIFEEDGEDADNIELIAGIGDFVVQDLRSGIYFLFKPYIWEAFGLLPLI